MKEYLATLAASKKYGWPEYRLRQWRKMGVLPGYVSGNRFYIDCAALQEQLDRYHGPLGMIQAEAAREAE